MIRIRLTNGDYIFGLDAVNVKRLQKGQPIVADLKPMGGHGRIMIMYGHTLDDVKRQLEDATGKPLPPPMEVNTPDH